MTYHANHDYTSDRYIPAGAQPVIQADVAAVVYFFEHARGGRPVPAAIAYSGKAGKPSYHNTYANEGQRQAHADQFFENCRKWEADIKERQAKRRAFQHTLKVGDVLYVSWGYDQTNINFWQVTALHGTKQVAAREISGEMVTGSETRDWGGQTVANPDHFIEREPERRFTVGSGNSLAIYSFADAYPWDGRPLHFSGGH